MTKIPPGWSKRVNLPPTVGDMAILMSANEPRGDFGSELTDLMMSIPLCISEILVQNCTFHIAIREPEPKLEI